MTKPAKVESRMITQNMNTASRLKESKNSETKGNYTSTPRPYAGKKIEGNPGSKQSPLLQGSNEGNRHESRQKATDRTAGEEKQPVFLDNSKSN